MCHSLVPRSDRSGDVIVSCTRGSLHRPTADTGKGLRRAPYSLLIVFSLTDSISTLNNLTANFFYGDLVDWW